MNNNNNKECLCERKRIREYIVITTTHKLYNNKKICINASYIHIYLQSFHL